MFEKKLGKIIRVIDPDILSRLRGRDGVAFDKINGAVVARPGNHNHLTWSGDGSVSFRRPRLLDGLQKESARVWLPQYNREHDELFRIDIECVADVPRFTMTTLFFPVSYIRERVQAMISFSSTTRAQFQSGLLCGFITTQRHPLCFKLVRHGNGFVSSRLVRLSVTAKAFGFKLKDYKFLKIEGEDIYFGQNLQQVRGGVTGDREDRKRAHDETGPAS